MGMSYPMAAQYLESLDIRHADPLDQVAWDLLCRRQVLTRGLAALEKKFSKSPDYAEALDRNNRETWIKMEGGSFWVEGTDNQWHRLDEAVWAVAMVELKKRKKKETG